MPGEMPVFVKIDEYKDVLDVVELIKNKIAQARDILRKIDDLKKEEESELQTWESSIEEIERRVEDIEQTLLEPEYS